MESHDFELQKRIMRRIRIIYYLRMLMSPLMRKVYFLSVLFAVVASLVSVRDVLANIPGEGLAAFGRFIVGALANADMPVQLLTVAMIIATALMVRDIVRAQGTPRFA